MWRIVFGGNPLLAEPELATASARPRVLVAGVAGVAVLHCAPNDIEKLLFFSAAISADAIHSQYDIPELVYEAEYPEGFPVINLGAWNDDPIVIKAIKEKIETFME